MFTCSLNSTKLDVISSMGRIGTTNELYRILDCLFTINQIENVERAYVSNNMQLIKEIPLGIIYIVLMIEITLYV